MMDESKTTDIVLAIGDMGSGGAQRVLSNLANAWTRAGRNICLITMESADRDFYPLDPGVQRVSIGGLGVSHNPISAIKANLSRLSGLRNAISQTGAPIAVTFLGSTNILVILATIGLGIRVVISERSDPKRQSLGRVWDVLRRVLYRFAHRITANSHGTIETLSAFVPKRKLAYVPNLLVLPTEESTVTFERQTIIASGRLDPLKAYDVLLDAFARIAQEAPDWQLVFLGDGPAKSALCEQAQRLGIADRSVFVGQVDNPFSYYRAADVFAHPSRYEGFPNALIEAMACGLPPIVSDASPGPLELVDAGRTGFVFPVDHSDELAEALFNLIKDASLRQRIGAAAMQRVSEFDPANALPVWDRVIGTDEDDRF